MGRLTTSLMCAEALGCLCRALSRGGGFRVRRVDHIVKPIRESHLGRLVWMQPKALVHAFELRAGDEVVGALRWDESAGALADAVAADGHWTPCDE